MRSKRLLRVAENSENLLGLAIEAARLRATLGEISMALEKVFGRYKPTDRRVSGVFSKEMNDRDEFKSTLSLSDLLHELVGRRPRILSCEDGSRWS